MKPAHTVQLGCWIALLTADLELSDYGMALRWMGENPPPSSRNVPPQVGVSEFLLWLLIRADSLLGALMLELADPMVTDPLRLESAIGRLLTAAATTADANELIPAPRLSEYLHMIRAEPNRASEALRARLDILGSLGVLPEELTVDDAPLPEPTTKLRALVAGMGQSPPTADGLATFLERKYFTSAFPDSTRMEFSREASNRILLWFVRAYLTIRRPLGFTPGRPVSLLACCLAARDGVAIEVGDTYDCVYEAANSQWAEFLHFSGGSRFDREFLIRIEPSLQSLLESTFAPRLP